MKKFIAGLIVGFVASSGLAMATASMDHNGIFWSKLSDPAKLGYVDGYGDAMQVSLGKLDSLRIAADLFHWKGARRVIRQLSTELSLSGLTTHRVVARLNRLYANPKYSQLDLGSALQLITFKTPRENAPTAEPSGH